MTKPSDYFKKLDLAHLDANTAQIIREKVLTLPNIDILENTKEFETLKAIIEENFPRAIGIEPVVIEPIVEVVPEVIVEEVITPVIDTKQIEIDSITTQVSEMSDLIELMNEVVSENKDDLDSKDILELYNDTLVDLKDKLSKLSVVILDAIEEVKENIEEVKEIIKTEVIDTKGILTAPKKHKTEDGEEVLGYESDWNVGTNKHLGETVVYYANKEGISGKYSVLTGILHKGEIIYSEDKLSNKEFESKFYSEKEALDFAYEISLDKEAIYKFENGGKVGLVSMDLEEYLANTAKWGSVEMGDVVSVLNAMIDSGLTDEDLKTPPTKTGTQYAKQKDLKTKEIWKKIHNKLGLELKDNTYYSTIYHIIHNNVSMDANILKRYKPWMKYNKFENGGEIKNIDKIKKSIGDTIYNHISSLNEEQLEKQLKELKVELNREYIDGNGKSERYKKLNDEMYYILYRLERATDDFRFKVGDKVQIIDEPKSSQKPYEVIGHENYSETYGWETIIKSGDEKLTMFENRLEKYNSDSDKDENIAKIRFNDHWKKVQLFIDGSLHGEFNTYQDAIEDAKNNNSKVIVEDDVTMLTISTQNPLSNQLSKITGDGWNSIDYQNLSGGNEVNTVRPFKHIASGKIFEVVKK